MVEGKLLNLVMKECLKECILVRHEKVLMEQLP